MKTILGLLTGICLLDFAGSVRALDLDLAHFSTAKEKQIRAYAEDSTNPVPAVVWRFFDAVRSDDWETATNLIARINRAGGRYATVDTNDVIAPALRTLVWSPICEMIGAFDQFHDWDGRWLHRFGREIIDSIPAGSIYFGGTDPGRFIVSTLCESQVAGRPFFTLTQNQLADGTYLDYLQKMYGKKIYIASADDSQQAFVAYTEDVTRRQKLGQLKPGEDVKVDNGRISISGQVAVMQTNGLLAKVVFDKNPQREFFVEESFPLDWMYPHLTPHGLIFQLNRQPVAELSEKMVATDQAYWKKLTGEMIGDWLTEDKTSLKDICDFVDQRFLSKNLDDFKGDKNFIKNASAQKCFSKLRSSLAGLYAWRRDHAQSADERERMQKAADLAFRQAYALCPSSPEAIYRYVNLLLSHSQPADAFLIAKTSLRLEPENSQLQDLVRQLKQNQ